MDLKLVAAPPVMPISIDDVKAHLRVLHNDDDASITQYIEAATQHLDGRFGLLSRPIISQEWEMRIAGFPRNNRQIQLPLPPLQSVENISYLDVEGISRILATTAYNVHPDEYLGTVTCPPDVTWPETYPVPGAVTVHFNCGFGAAASSVPAPIKHAISLLVGHWYMSRQAATEKPPRAMDHAVQALIAPYQIPKV